MAAEVDHREPEQDRPLGDDQAGDVGQQVAHAQPPRTEALHLQRRDVGHRAFLQRRAAQDAGDVRGVRDRQRERRGEQARAEHRRGEHREQDAGEREDDVEARGDRSRRTCRRTTPSRSPRWCRSTTAIGRRRLHRRSSVRAPPSAGSAGPGPDRRTRAGASRKGPTLAKDRSLGVRVERSDDRPEDRQQHREATITTMLTQPTTPILRQPRRGSREACVDLGDGSRISALTRHGSPGSHAGRAARRRYR